MLQSNTTNWLITCWQADKEAMELITLCYGSTFNTHEPLLACPANALKFIRVLGDESAAAAVVPGVQ